MAAPIYALPMMLINHGDPRDVVDGRIWTGGVTSTAAGVTDLGECVTCSAVDLCAFDHREPFDQALIDLPREGVFTVHPQLQLFCLLKALDVLMPGFLPPLTIFLAPTASSPNSPSGSRDTAGLELRYPTLVCKPSN
jgi:hypothetical protein